MNIASTSGMIANAKAIRQAARAQMQKSLEEALHLPVNDRNGSMKYSSSILSTAATASSPAERDTENSASSWKDTLCCGMWRLPYS
jgi:hypothetical protein